MVGFCFQPISVARFFSGGRGENFSVSFQKNVDKLFLIVALKDRLKLLN